ncbi:ATPase associated with various cellular activities AAA 5 protein, partial [Haloplasma contractile SSD-17B]
MTKKNGVNMNKKYYRVLILILLLILFSGGLLLTVFFYNVEDSDIDQLKLIKSETIYIIISLSFILLIFLLHILRILLKRKKYIKKQFKFVKKQLKKELKRKKRSLKKGIKIKEEKIEEESSVEEKTNTSRFFMLKEIDKKREELANIEFNDDITLKQMCEDFRNYAAQKLGLNYDIKVIRRFVCGLAVTKILILQGMSGTGKTSLAYAFGEFIDNPTVIVPVQPMWKERTDLIGYYNEFT